MILVDTSVWIDHLHQADDILIVLLEHNEVLMHPMIIGELACGNLRNRQELLPLWHSLPAIVTATDAEALQFLERQQLMGKGIGFIAVHLLSAVSLQDDARLWTRDNRLARLADDLGLGVTVGSQ